MGIIYILVSTYPASKRTVEKQKAKSLSPGGTVSQTPAPAQAPHPQTAPIQSPEGYADLRYGKSDSNENIPPQDQQVNNTGANSRVRTAAIFFTFLSYLSVKLGKGYIKNKNKKSQSLGNGPQAPAPAQVPYQQTESTKKPEGHADGRYGKSDSAENISPQTQQVNNTGVNSRVRTAACRN